jgi:hypothetical protein
VLVDGKNVADGWFMKGLTFHVREKRFKGDSAGGGTLVVNADWIVNSTPEVDYVARETTKVRVYPLKDGARRIDFDTVITARSDTLGLGGSDDAKGYGGFSVRLIKPDRLTFGSGGKTVTPAVGRSRPARPWASPGRRAAARRPGPWAWLQGQRRADHPLDPAQGTVDAELRLPRPGAVRAEEGRDPAPAVDADPAAGDAARRRRARPWPRSST